MLLGRFGTNYFPTPHDSIATLVAYPVADGFNRRRKPIGENPHCPKPPRYLCTPKMTPIKSANPWHAVSPGPNMPDEVRAIIEIPKGSRAKYELDKETGLLMLDRVLYSSVYYPANYGFIPRTYCDDGDPLDILVLSQIEMQPLCLVNARIIGVMRMLDQGEADDKLIAVCANDMSVNHLRDISEMPDHFIAELRHFFEEYKRLENKVVKIEEFQGARLAKKILQHAIKDYEALIAGAKEILAES